MSSNQQFALCAAQKELVVRECQRIVFDAADVKPGETIKEQIRNAARNLGKPYGMVRRAWFGLGGPKVLPQLREAYERFDASQRAKAEQEFRALHRRIARLEAERGGGLYQDPDLGKRASTGPRLDPARALRRTD